MDCEKIFDDAQTLIEQLTAQKTWILTELAKNEPEEFLKQARKIVEDTTRGEHKATVDNILRQGKIIKDNSERKKYEQNVLRIMNSMEGMLILLRSKISDHEIAARRAGVDWSPIETLIKIKALELSQEDTRTVKAETHKVANDKVTAKFFNPTTKQWERGLMNIWENPNDKKRKEKIITPVAFKSSEDGKIAPRYNRFDRAVFNACYSLQAAGNLVTTTDILFAHMTGKDGRGKPSQEMRRKIKDSIIKMSRCWVRIDMERVNSAFGYKDPKTIREGQLLYAKFEETRVNGKTTKDAVIFLDKSPLIQVAEVKKQILSYPMELLDVPISASEESIIVREELLRRMQTILNHDTEPSILFESLLEPVGYNNMRKEEKLRERKKVCKMLDAWKEKGLFNDYTIKKAGNIPVKIVIDKGRTRAGK